MNMRNVCVLAWAASALLGAPHLAIEIARQAGRPIVLGGMPLDDSERAYFAESVAHIDGQRVIHLGPVDHRQKSDLLKDAAGFLFPIQWEELFGLVMIEAMACGTPVVALRRGSVEEVVDLGKTGYYGDSIEELTRLVRSAFALDRALVRQHAQTRFGAERMTDDYIDAYYAVLSASRMANRDPQESRETRCAS